MQRRDLGGVADDIKKIVDDSRKELPRGSEMVIRGQVQTMKSSYIGLISGLAFAILLVYLLIVVNFQSWLDPFIIISALPAALAGIVWFLFVTKTNISVPALTGSIMCMGVATANSILVVSFAKEQMDEGKDALTAAMAAGFTRFRPGPDDGAGHDHRHDADGRWPGRRRRAECAAGPRGNWRLDFCHGRDPVLCSRVLQPAAWTGSSRGQECEE